MPKKLLLADDSVTIQRVIQLTFADEDVDVIAVGDGRQAIERIEREAPDIVLADVGMPQQDGYEVATYIKSRPHLAHIPVVLLAGAFDPIDDVRAKQAGCDGVMAKPFEPQQVIARVRELLGVDAPTIRMPAPPKPDRGLDDFAFQAPAADAASTSPAAGTGAARSLDDYFDRLDLDLNTAVGGATRPPAAAPPPAPAVPMATTASGVDDWLPPAAAPAPPPLAARPNPAPAPATFAGPPPDGHANPSLADAFAALLATEQGAPAPGAQFGMPAMSEEMLDLLVTRVLERMTGNTVADVVTRVAERLVREEIDKIKNAQ